VHGALDIQIAEARQPDFTLSGDPNLIAAMVYGGSSLEAVQAAGLRAEGELSLAERFATLFPLPEKAEATAGGSQDSLAG